MLDSWMGKVIAFGEGARARALAPRKGHLWATGPLRKWSGETRAAPRSMQIPALIPTRVRKVLLCSNQARPLSIVAPVSMAIHSGAAQSGWACRRIYDDLPSLRPSNSPLRVAHTCLAHI